MVDGEALGGGDGRHPAQVQGGQAQEGGIGDNFDNIRDDGNIFNYYYPIIYIVSTYP